MSNNNELKLELEKILSNANRLEQQKSKEEIENLKVLIKSLFDEI